MKVDDRFVKSDYKGKKKQKEYIKAAAESKLTAYIKHPITGEAIAVHPDFVKKISKGETVTLDEIMRGIQ